MSPLLFYKNYSIFFDNTFNSSNEKTTAPIVAPAAMTAFPHNDRNGNMKFIKPIAKSRPAIEVNPNTYMR